MNPSRPAALSILVLTAGSLALASPALQPASPPPSPAAKPHTIAPAARPGSRPQPARPGVPPSGQPVSAPTPTPPPPSPAQPAMPPPAPPVYTPPTWSTPEIQKLAGMLTGSWKATTPASHDAKGVAAAPVDIWMHITPLRVQGLESTLYVESARADAPHRPYRQAIFQLYPYKGKTRLRTYEFRARDASSMTGLWLAPQYLPTLAANELIATLDVELSPSADGFSGKTPYAYPTGVQGAVEMTSELAITPGTLTTKDRGYDAAGKVVWGSSENDAYTFKKSPAPYTADIRDNGLVVISMHPGSGELKATKGQRVTMHYTGWFLNGQMYDSTLQRKPPTPLIYNHPAGAVHGVSLGMEGATKGEIRRLVIPWDLAYGATGYRNIPPYSTIILETEVMNIDTLPPTPAPQPDSTPGGLPDAPVPATPVAPK